MSRHPFEQAHDQVHRLRATDNLLVNNEARQPVDFLPTLAIGEVSEVEAELDAPRELNLQKLGDESNDVMVFVLAILQNRFPHIQPSEQLDGVNGYGRHSAALDNLKPVLAESGNDPRALIESLRRLWSIANYLPVPYVGLQTFDQTIDKVLGNRPPALYSGRDPITGKVLLGDEATAAFRHFESGLRLIRTQVKRTLTPADWRPYYSLLSDWRNSEPNIALLKQRLASNHDIVVMPQGGTIYSS